MLKALRAEVRRLDGEIRGDLDDSLNLIVVNVAGAAEGDPVELPCAGYAGGYHLAGKRLHLFFPGTDPEPLARALLDHAHRIERQAGIRPGLVLMQQQTAPDDAVSIEQPPEGITTAEHVARLYDALRAAA